MQNFCIHLTNRLPFDTNNPIGFSTGIIVQCIFVFNSMVTVKCLAIFGVETCFIVFPLARDVKCNLEMINHNAKCKRNRSKINGQLYEFVQFHSELIQLSQIQLIENKSQ